MHKRLHHIQSYMCGISVALPGLLPCCYVIWDHNLYAAKYLNDNSVYSDFDSAINYTTVIVMVFCYSCIMYKVRRSRVLVQKWVFYDVTIFE
jgi:hypothetical protein